jgi:DNA anti-recombination protein RmuC
MDSEVKQACSRLDRAIERFEKKKKTLSENLKRVNNALTEDSIAKEEALEAFIKGNDELETLKRVRKELEEVFGP